MKHTKKLLSLLLVLCLILSLSCTAFAADEAKPLTGKTVIPFATSGGSGMGGEDVLRSACSKGTKWLPGKRLSSRESMASVQKWVESLGL